MATFIATYLGPTGQQRTVTVKAAGIAEAKKQLRRRGIRATELRTATEPSNSKGSPEDHGASGALGFDLSRALEKNPWGKRKSDLCQQVGGSGRRRCSNRAQPRFDGHSAKTTNVQAGADQGELGCE
jgi:hypothetical protein